MPSLAQQLARSGAPSLEAAPKFRASVLFDAREAANVDARTILEGAVNGVLELGRMDARFRPFLDAGSLFADAALRVERSLLAPADEAALAGQLASFLELLSPFLQLRPAQKALEFLVRQYEVHRRSVHQLLACALPSHDSELFGRIAVILELPAEATEWAFLKNTGRKPVPLPRSALVQAAARNVRVLEFITEMAVSAGARSASASRRSGVFALFAAVCAEVPVSEPVLLALLPPLRKALACARSVELQTAAYMVATSLAARASLSDRVVQALLQDTARHYAEPLRDHALLAMAAVAHHSRPATLAPQVVEALVGRSGVAAALGRLHSDRDISVFLGLLLTALAEADEEDGVLQQILVSASLGPLARSVAVTLLGRPEPNAQALRALSARFSAELDAAVADVLRSGGDEVADKVTSALAAALGSGSRHAPLAGAGAPLAVALEHPSPELRVAAIRQLSAEDVPASALLRRVLDDDADVAQAALQCGLLVDACEPEELLAAVEQAEAAWAARVGSAAARKTLRACIELLAGPYEAAHGFSPRIAAVLLRHLPLPGDKIRAHHTAAVAGAVALRKKHSLLAKFTAAKSLVAVEAVAAALTADNLEELRAAAGPAVFAAVVTAAAQLPSLARQTDLVRQALRTPELGPEALAALAAHLPADDQATRVAVLQRALLLPDLGLARDLCAAASDPAALLAAVWLSEASTGEVKVKALHALRANAANAAAAAAAQQAALLVAMTDPCEPVRDAALQCALAVESPSLRALLTAAAHGVRVSAAHLPTALAADPRGDLVAALLAAGSPAAIAVLRLTTWETAWEEHVAAVVEALPEALAASRLRALFADPTPSDRAVDFVCSRLSTALLQQGCEAWWRALSPKQTERALTALCAALADEGVATPLVQAAITALPVVDAQLARLLAADTSTAALEVAHLRTDVCRSGKVFRALMAQIDDDDDYRRYLALSGLRACAEGADPKLGVKAADLDALLGVIRVSDNAQTRNSALLVLAALAATSPSNVLDSLLPVFRLVGEMRDDNYSLFVTQEIVRRVVPALCAVPKPVPALQKMLALFVESTANVPTDKRLRLATLLLKTAVPSAVAAFAQMVLAAEGEGGVFLHTALHAFPPQQQVRVLTVLLRRARGLPEAKASMEEEGLPAGKGVRVPKERLLAFTAAHLAAEALHRQLLALRGDALEVVETEYLLLAQELLALLSAEPAGGARDVLKPLQRLLSLPSFVAVVSELLGGGDRSTEVRVQALQLLTAKAQGPALSDAGLDLVLDVMEDVEAALSGDGDGDGDDDDDDGGLLAQTALQTVAAMAKAYGARSPDAFDACGPLVVALAQRDEEELRASALLAFAALTSALGPRMCGHLPRLMPSLLGALERQEEAALPALTVLLSQLPQFLGPFLAPALRALLDVDADEQPLAERCLALISTGLPARQAVPRLVAAFDADAASVPATLRVLQLVARAIVAMPQSDVPAQIAPLFAFVLRALEARPVLEKRGGDEAAAADEVEGAVVEVFLELVMRLSERQLAPLIMQLLQWAPSADEAPPARRRALFRVLEALGQRLKAIVVPYFAHAWEHCVEELALFAAAAPGASEQQAAGGRKRRREPAVSERPVAEGVVRALSECFKSAEGSVFITEARFSTMFPALLAIVAAPGVGRELVVPALGLLVRASPDKLWKGANRDICMLTRHDDDALRLAATEALAAVYRKVGEEFLMLLPETLPFVSELLDDNDADVEAACKALVRLLEELSGENMDAYLTA